MPETPRWRILAEGCVWREAGLLILPPRALVGSVAALQELRAGGCGGVPKVGARLMGPAHHFDPPVLVLLFVLAILGVCLMTWPEARECD